MMLFFEKRLGGAGCMRGGSDGGNWKKGTKEKSLAELQEYKIPSDRKHLGEIVMEGKFENKIAAT